MTNRKRRTWNGDTTTQRRLHVIATHGRTCWLCGHEILMTVSIDHVHPVSTHPELEHEPTNWRPAHLNGAASVSSDRCLVPDCTCPGNTGRKAQPWTAPPSRSW